jgi:hypothetical protein
LLFFSIFCLVNSCKAISTIIEAVYSFLKTQYSLAINKVRGVRNVASYALYSLLCLVLNREAAENIGRPDKAVSPTYFNT